MVRRILGNQDDGGNPLRRVRVHLKGRVPEVFEMVLLAGEEGGVRSLLVARKRQRERDLGHGAIRTASFAFEIEHREVTDPRCAKGISVGARIATFESEHRQAFAMSEKVAVEGAERE